MWLVSYKKPPLIGPIVNPKPGATIAKPTAAPWFEVLVFKDAVAVYPGEAKPIPTPTKVMPQTMIIKLLANIIIREPSAKKDKENSSNFIDGPLNLWINVSWTIIEDIAIEPSEIAVAEAVW